MNRHLPRFLSRLRSLAASAWRSFAGSGKPENAGMAVTLHPCEAVRSEIAALRQQVEHLTARLGEVERNAEPVIPAPRPGFNLSRRSHVLRLARRGDSSSQIAASLEMPRQEVDLLLKVHQIVMKKV
jgi:hypothetical protein